MTRMEDGHLNKEQLEAVTHGAGPLLVIAGAGTGKTTVITERIKYLIAEGLARPGEILALTFTEKAAREMEERIDIALPYGYTQMWVSTFHAFCDKLLRDEAINIGLNPAFKLISEAEGTVLLRDLLIKLDLSYFLPLGNPNKFVAALLNHIGRLKDEDISPSQYSVWAKQKKTHAQTEEEILEAKKYIELSQIYSAYEDLKTNQSSCDFEDLIANTLKLFRTRPNILKQYHQKFTHILVDEFQDTNYAQNQLLILLCGKNPNLTVVGDDDQSVYKWRGAAISNIIQFKAFYPRVKIVVLNQNYRSNQEILDRAYTLIQYNNPDRLEAKEKISKKLVSIRKEKGRQIEFIHTGSVEDEAEAIVKKILSLTHPSFSPAPLSYKDIAILVRANSHADPFIRALSRSAIPHQFLGPGRLYHQPEIKDLIAYLKVLNNFEDDASFYRVLSLSYFNIPGRDLAAIGNFGKRFALHLFEVCELLSGKSHSMPGASVPFVSQPTIKTVTLLVEIIHRHLDLVPKETAGQILFFFLSDTGMLKSILEYTHPINERRAENIMKFFNKLKTFETQMPDATIRSAVDWLDLSMSLGESPLAASVDWTQNNAVNLLTVHSAKGLEFPAVFLVNLAVGRFPTTEKREQIPVPDELIKEVLPEGDYHLEEERRLFYVGMTRAKDFLFLSSADYYGEGKRERKISPFVFESLGLSSHSLPSASYSQLSLLDWHKPPLPDTQFSAAKSVTINYLSYSQIQTFLDCPLHYKARYILKIPTPPTPALAFGSTIHSFLKDFYLKVKTNPGVSKSGLEKMLFDLLRQNWNPEGFNNKSHEQKYLAKGQEYLKGFLENHFDPARLPVALEVPFTVPLNQNLKIGGKIDRVDLLSNGSIEILDYKTGKSPPQKDIEKDLQLSFYALAATSIAEPPFAKNPQQVKLTLFYLEEQKLKTTTRTPEQLELAKNKIQDYAAQISASDFHCSGSYFCQECEYKILCDL